MWTDASRPRAWARALAVAMIVVGGVGGLAVGQRPARADVNEVSGLAFAAAATVLGVVSPPAPPGVAGSASEGGNPAFDTGLMSSVPLSVPGIVSVGALQARTFGGEVAGDNHLAYVTSMARVVSVVVGNGLGGIPLDAVTVECTSDGEGSRATVQIAGPAGSPFPRSPDPGTAIDILGVARIVLNEQTRVNVPGLTTSIGVNAVRIELLSATGGSPIAQIVLGHVECEAEGPDVLITMPPTTSASTTARPTTTRTAPTSTTAPTGTGVNTTTTVAATQTPTTQPEVLTTQPSGRLPRTGMTRHALGVVAALGAVLGLLLVRSSRAAPASAGAEAKRG